MEREEYEKLHRVEDRLWWFAALHANLLMLYRRPAAGTAAGSLLDAGCGTGGFLARLREHFPDVAALGLDADEGACRWAAEKSTQPICAGSVDALPYADGAFGAIVSADVLCHRDVDEDRALRDFHRCLIAGGVLILNLPAYRWLMSRHDTAVSNARRYTRRRVVRMLRGAGFRPVFTGYWNTVLFPLMVATRKLLPGGAGSDVKTQPAPIDALCRAATAFERRLMRAGIRFPFGGSVLALAAKPETANG